MQGAPRAQWRNRAPTKELVAYWEVSPGQLGSALGPVIIKTLAQRSGPSEEEVTKQLSQILLGVVDRLTPHGRVPTVAELSQIDVKREPA
jgi:uncharacterized protein YidB (DUF937 family)